MNVHAFQSGDTYHVSVQGNLQSLADREAFLSVLQPGDYRKFEMSFFDARVLPAEVVLRIREFQETLEGKRLRISVFHRYLAAYLFRLGIPASSVHSAQGAYRDSGRVRAIALGGSAGSLDKIMTIVSSLPRQEVSIFIIQHILENEPNYLGEILKRNSAFGIPVPTDGMPVKPGNIYIAQPGHHLSVETGRIRLSAGPKKNFARPSIQVAFDSLADEYGQGLIAVLLCGYGDDGVNSFAHLKQKGALILAEDPPDCEARDLVTQAWKSGLLDYRFPLPELAHYLARVIEPPEPRIEESDLRSFLSLLHEKYGYDYRHYSSQSAIRRISRVMSDHHIFNFKRFSELVLQDPDLFENLFLECSINVTEFFRNPETFKAIRNKVLTYLDSFPHIKIWSAGCSTGQEAVSLAVLLEELGLLQKSQIYASDINPYVVEEAQNGIYPQKLIREGQANYEAAGGKRNFSDFFDHSAGLSRLKPRLRDRILYFQHSLLNRGAFNEFHLILCRNVLIYFDQNLQQAVLDLFSRSLDMNGFLVLGESEGISSFPLGLELFDKPNKIFKKII